MTQRNVVQRSAAPTPRPAPAHAYVERWLALLTGATVAGVGASLPFTYIYLARPQEPHWSHFGGLFLAGAAYSVLVAAARALQNTMAQRAVGADDARTVALRGILAEVLTMDQPLKHIAAMISGLDVAYDLGGGHPLLGRRMPSHA